MLIYLERKLKHYGTFEPYYGAPFVHGHKTLDLKSEKINRFFALIIKILFKKVFNYEHKPDVKYRVEYSGDTDEYYFNFEINNEFTIYLGHLLTTREEMEEKLEQYMIAQVLYQKTGKLHLEGLLEKYYVNNDKVYKDNLIILKKTSNKNLRRWFTDFATETGNTSFLEFYERIDNKALMTSTFHIDPFWEFLKQNSDLNENRLLCILFIKAFCSNTVLFDILDRISKDLNLKHTGPKNRDHIINWISQQRISPTELFSIAEWSMN